MCRYYCNGCFAQGIEPTLGPLQAFPDQQGGQMCHRCGALLLLCACCAPLTQIAAIATRVSTVLQCLAPHWYILFLLHSNASSQLSRRIHTIK